MSLIYSIKVTTIFFYKANIPFRALLTILLYHIAQKKKILLHNKCLVNAHAFSIKRVTNENDDDSSHHSSKI